jgi:hypothetical protein
VWWAEDIAAGITNRAAIMYTTHQHVRVEHISTW